MVTLELKMTGADQRAVAITVRNGTRKPITVITHPRYWVVELQDARKQYVKGGAAILRLPTPDDFVTIGAGAQALALTLPIERAQFPGVGAQSKLRVTYKPDAVISNMPRTVRDSFFRGPIDATLAGVDIATAAD